MLADFDYPDTLDPLTTRTDAGLRAAALAFQPLWGIGPGLQPYPALVGEVPTVANGRVRVSGGSMTVDVGLLPGLRWSDGAPLTADDLIFTWQAIVDPALGAVAAPEFARITRIDRISDTEVRWVFERPYGGYLLLGADLWPLPSHRLSGSPPAAWGRSPFFQKPDAVSGPFAVTGTVAGQSITFERNPEYRDAFFRHRAHLDRVVFRFQPGKESMLAEMRSGSADIGFHFATDDLHQLAGLPGSSTIATTGLRTEFLNPNHGPNTAGGRAPPWVGDAPVLDALAMAVDRRALVAQALGEAGRPSSGLYPALMAGWSDPGLAAVRPRDLAGARALLESDGWRAAEDGVRSRDGRRLAFSLLGVCGNAVSAAELGILKQQWREAGAVVTTDCRRRGVFFADAAHGGVNATGAFDMTLYSNTWAPDPDGFSTFGASGSPANWNRCAEPALDSALAEGAGTLDPARRQAAYRLVERHWLGSHCTIPLFEWPDVRQVSARVHNFVPNPVEGMDPWNSADWWMAPGRG